MSVIQGPAQSRQAGEKCSVKIGGHWARLLLAPGVRGASLPALLPGDDAEGLEELELNLLLQSHRFEEIGIERRPGGFHEELPPGVPGLLGRRPRRHVHCIDLDPEIPG